MAEVDTIQVHYVGKGKDVFRINESDFDPKVHKKLTDKEEAQAEEAEDKKSKK